MLTEHAVTYSQKIALNEFEYLVKKANRLGQRGKKVIRVYQKEESDAMHVYFDVTENWGENIHG